MHLAKKVKTNRVKFRLDEAQASLENEKQELGRLRLAHANLETELSHLRDQESSNGEAADLMASLQSEFQAQKQEKSNLQSEVEQLRCEFDKLLKQFIFDLKIVQAK